MQVCTLNFKFELFCVSLQLLVAILNKYLTNGHKQAESKTVASVTHTYLSLFQLFLKFQFIGVANSSN